MRFVTMIVFAVITGAAMAADAPTPQPKPPTIEQLQAQVVQLQHELAAVRAQRNSSTQAAQDCYARSQ